MISEIDIGDTCIHCSRSTAFGTGRFVNRIPAVHSEGVDMPQVVGYICEECLSTDKELES